ncbi:hypothetical protein ACH4GE_40795 [Streptomyces tendae]|uniref:hypothetical protein n=1 Tax=Streptomyces tendae TaxID=1932 RepID=UPI00378E4F20
MLGAAVTSGPGYFDALGLGEYVTGDVLEVITQLQESALGCLPALELQSVPDPAPCDLEGPGGADELALVGFQLVAQRTDDQERGKHAGFGHVRVTVAGALHYQVVFRGDARHITVGYGELAGHPGQFTFPLAGIMLRRSV